MRGCYGPAWPGTLGRPQLVGYLEELTDIMNKSNAIKGIAIVAGLTAGASQALAAAPRAESPVQVVVTAGLTAGGDTIAKVEYTNGDNAKIKGGGLVQVGAGVQFHPVDKPFS